MSETIRLIWKEYRALRGLWLALAIFGMACDAMIFFLVKVPEDRLAGCFGFAGVLPLGFALGAGAMLFALEREEATYDFLRCLPVTSARVFAGKVLTALMATLLLALLLLSVTLNDVRLVVFPHRSLAAIDGFLDDQNLSRLNNAFDVALVYALFAMQGIGWSAFFSLQAARTLLAALLGVLGAVTCISLMHFATESFGFGKLHGTWDAPGLHVAATLAVWSANIWLGSRWLHGRRWSARLRCGDTDALGTYKRLLWQEWRSSYRLLVAIVVLGALVPAMLWPLFMPTTILGFALLGSCTFLADQESRQFRFFAERGVSPRRLWLSRQLFWGGAALGLAAVLLLAKRLFVHFALGLAPSDVQHLWRTMSWVFVPLNYLIWVALAFAAGQACSMFFQSGILAAALGVLLAGLFGGWMSAMQALDIGLWWSAAPIAVALFAATWLRSTGWLLERHTWRAWSPALLVPALTIATLLVSVPAYRVWEIPAALTSVDVAPPSQPSAKAVLAAGRLERLCESLSGLASTGLSPNYDALSPLRLAKNSAPGTAEIEWLKWNEGALNQAISAIDELPRDATIASGRPSASPHLGFDVIGAMILRYGQLAEAGGKLDEAWERYRSVVKLAAFVRRENGVSGEVIGNSLVAATATQVIRWGAGKGQTVAQLRAAIATLVGSEFDAPSLEKVVLDDYRDYVAIVDRIAARPDQGDPAEVLMAKWAPWEIARLRRLLRYEASLHLLEARAADLELTNLSGLTSRARREVDAAESQRYWRTTLVGPMFEVAALLRSRCFAVCHRRAAELALAAQAWRVEHGTLPETLEPLQGVYFDALPVDPHTGRSFAWFPWGVSERVRSHRGSEVAAGTPFLYSIGTDGNWWPEEKWLEDLRRRSADEPIARPQSPSEGGMPAAPVPSGGASDMSPRRIGESLDNLGGLLFPIPVKGSES